MCKSMRLWLQWGLLSLGLLVTSLSVAVAEPDRSGPEAARLATYDMADGESYFALSLTPKVRAADTAARDVVMVFDTSASQTGVYRDDGLEALRTALAGLDAGDRVKLLAADLGAVPLTPDFVAPGSPELDAALEKLGL